MNTGQSQRVPGFFLGAILGSVTLLVSPVSAQQEQQSQPKDLSRGDAAAQGQSKTSDKDRTNQPVTPPNGTSNDRLFYTLPNFLALENTRQLPPFATGEKCKVVLRGSFDFVEFPWYGLLTGISQAENSEAAYGQGAAGYGKRYATAFADGTIESIMVGAVLPSVLRQDPRHYQLGHGGFLHRVGYAVSRIFITAADSGSLQFNYSEVFGAAIAGRNLHLQLPSSSRSDSADRPPRVGHAGRIRYDRDRPEGVLAGYSQETQLQTAARCNQALNHGEQK